MPSILRRSTPHNKPILTAGQEESVGGVWTGDMGPTFQGGRCLPWDDPAEKAPAPAERLFRPCRDSVSQKSGLQSPTAKAMGYCLPPPRGFKREKRGRSVRNTGNILGSVGKSWGFDQGGTMSSLAQ